jgi:hypothetical protein
MSPLVELLGEIRKRPAMYLGSEDVVKLAAFLRGFQHALHQYEIARQDTFLRDFRDWVAKRFAVSISRSWEGIIAFQAVDDREAMELFWKLLDEYLLETTTHSTEEKSVELPL